MNEKKETIVTTIAFSAIGIAGLVMSFWIFDVNASMKNQNIAKANAVQEAQSYKYERLTGYDEVAESLKTCKTIEVVAWDNTANMSGRTNSLSEKKLQMIYDETKSGEVKNISLETEETLAKPKFCKFRYKTMKANFEIRKEVNKL